jgi:hypothetical protein
MVYLQGIVHEGFCIVHRAQQKVCPHWHGSSKEKIKMNSLLSGSVKKKILTSFGWNSPCTSLAERREERKYNRGLEKEECGSADPRRYATWTAARGFDDYGNGIASTPFCSSSFFFIFRKQLISSNKSILR